MFRPLTNLDMSKTTSTLSGVALVMDGASLTETRSDWTYPNGTAGPIVYSSTWLTGLCLEDNKYVQHEIRTNAICPRHVDPPPLDTATKSDYMDAEILATPLKRIGQVEEIVVCIGFVLASSMSSFISGATLKVDKSVLQSKPA